jgi:hypothetical protein
LKKKGVSWRVIKLKKPVNKGFEGFEGLLILLLAERVGFEPTVQFNPYDDLANRSFRPLRHLSLTLLFKGWQKYTINLKVKSKNEEKANKDFTLLLIEPFVAALSRFL